MVAKIGVVGGPGDRRDEDLILLGNVTAKIFDRIIIKEDRDSRGRNPGEVADLIAKGIYQTNPDATHEVILDETEATNTALALAQADNLVVIFPEKVERAIGLIKEKIKNK